MGPRRSCRRPRLQRMGATPWQLLLGIVAAVPNGMARRELAPRGLGSTARWSAWPGNVMSAILVGQAENVGSLFPAWRSEWELGRSEPECPGARLTPHSNVSWRHERSPPDDHVRLRRALGRQVGRVAARRRLRVLHGVRDLCRCARAQVGAQHEPACVWRGNGGEGVQERDSPAVGAAGRWASRDAGAGLAAYQTAAALTMTLFFRLAHRTYCGSLGKGLVVISPCSTCRTA